MASKPERTAMSASMAQSLSDSLISSIVSAWQMMLGSKKFGLSDAENIFSVAPVSMAPLRPQPPDSCRQTFAPHLWQRSVRTVVLGMEW